MLQLALRIAHAEGRFSRLATVLAAGQAGMEDSGWTDLQGDGNFGYYYAKTARGMVQGFCSSATTRTPLSALRMMWFVWLSVGVRSHEHPCR